MGQTQSTVCADKQGTDNLPMQGTENDIEILRQLAETKGPIAVSEFINKSLNRWKTEQVNFAITGRSATGKSTFINTIRNVKPGDDGFAKAGSGDTTVKPMVYMHPKNKKIAFYDLPGYSTTKFKKEDYIREMKISDYHFFFIFFNNVLSEDEIWLVREFRSLGKPFALVRSKIDTDIDNAIHDGKDKEKIIPEIKAKIQKALDANPELKDTKGIFLISCRKPDLGEMSKLMEYVEENISGLKAQAVLFTLGTITTKMLEKKYQSLKSRILLNTAIAAGVAAIPVPGLDVAVNITMLVVEVSHYLSVFGVEREKVDSLEDFDHSSLKCRSLLEPNVDMAVAVAARIGTSSLLLLAESAVDLIIPIIGSIISSITAARVTYKFLDDMLQDVYHDAMLIYAHVVKMHEDHGM